MKISELFSGNITIDEIKVEHVEKFGAPLPESKKVITCPPGLDWGEYRKWLYRCPDIVMYRGGINNNRSCKWWKIRF